MLNYEKLTAYQPTEYGRMTNSIGQEIIFVEHPISGDFYFIIAVCHELKLAAATDFFELDDMTADHGEYEPLFIDGNFQHGN
jgi:hypothetical protein